MSFVFFFFSFEGGEKGESEIYAGEFKSDLNLIPDTAPLPETEGISLCS